jgi:hypothetical protein
VTIYKSVGRFAKDNLYFTSIIHRNTVQLKCTHTNIRCHPNAICARLQLAVTSTTDIWYVLFVNSHLVRNMNTAPEPTKNEKSRKVFSFKRPTLFLLGMYKSIYTQPSKPTPPPWVAIQGYTNTFQTQSHYNECSTNPHLREAFVHLVASEAQPAPAHG